MCDQLVREGQLQAEMEAAITLGLIIHLDQARLQNTVRGRAAAAGFVNEMHQVPGPHAAVKHSSFDNTTSA